MGVQREVSVMIQVDVVGYIVTACVGVIGFFLKRTMTRLDATEKDVQTIKENYVKESDHKDSLHKIDEDIKDVKKDIKTMNANFLTKEDFFREQRKTEQQLERILDILLKSEV